MPGARFDRRHVIAMLGAMFGFPHLAPAQQGWPARSVRYVLGFAAGGPTDTLSRVFCQKMSSLTGQQFAVPALAPAAAVFGLEAAASWAGRAAGAEALDGP